MALAPAKPAVIPEPAPDALGELVVQELTGLPVIWKPLDPKTGRSQFDAHPDGEGYSLADWERDRDSGLYSETQLAAWRAGCFLRIRCTKAEADAHWAEVEMPAPDPAEVVKALLGTTTVKLDEALAEIAPAKPVATRQRQPVKAYTLAALSSAAKTYALDANIIRKEWLSAAATAVPVTPEEVAEKSGELDTRANAVVTVGTGKTYSTIAAGNAAASYGDLIECYATDSNTYSEAVALAAGKPIVSMVANHGLKITKNTGTTVTCAAPTNTFIRGFTIATTSTSGVGGVTGNATSPMHPAFQNCRVVNEAGSAGTTIGLSLNNSNSTLGPAAVNCLITGFNTGVFSNSTRASVLMLCTIAGNVTGVSATTDATAYLIACLVAGNSTTQITANKLGTATSCFVVTSDESADGNAPVDNFDVNDFEDTTNYKIKAASKATTLARIYGQMSYRTDGFGSVRRNYAGGYFYAGWHDPDPGYIPAAAEVLSTVTAYGLDNELAGSATAESHTANQVLKSAGGNYNDDNLSVGNIRPVAFGLSQTGDLSNLVATDGAYVTLENSRNNDNGTVATDIVTGKSVKIRNTTITGASDKLYSAAEEAARNTDPGVAKVELSTNYKHLNDSKVGTLVVKDITFAEEAVRNTDPGVAKVELATNYKHLNVDKVGTLNPGGGSAIVSEVKLTESRTIPGERP